MRPYYLYTYMYPGPIWEYDSNMYGMQAGCTRGLVTLVRALAASPALCERVHADPWVKSGHGPYPVWL